MWGVGSGFFNGALPLQQALIAERTKTISAKDDMVKHANAEHVAGLFQPSRDLLVFRAWRRSPLG